MSRVAWFNCFSGIAGDMALGALLDAGADIEEVRALLDRLPIGGWELTAEPTLRSGITGVDVRVHADESHDHRRASEILSWLENAGFPDRMADRARSTFELLAEVEGRLHGVPPGDVHFHEVGAVDSIVDVVGACAALEVLDIDVVRSSGVATGSGTTDSAHGTLPVPVPAAVALLSGAPVYGTNDPFELTTPTGAALLAATVVDWGPMPSMIIETTGYGAGDRDLEGRPNLVQVVIGTSTDIRGPGVGTGTALVQLEVNVDDATGETLAHTVNRCLEVGARDAWVTPVIMKKGRPAHVVSALCDPSDLATVSSVLTAETGSLGVRSYGVERWSATRSFHEIEFDGHLLAVKVAAGRVKVENDDAVRVAAATGRPLREIVTEVEALWVRENGPPGGE